MDDFDINSILRNAVKEFEEDKFLNLLNLVTTIISSKKSVQIEELIIEGKIEGFEEKDIYKAIEKLKKDRILIEENGVLKRV